MSRLRCPSTASPPDITVFDDNVGGSMMQKGGSTEHLGSKLEGDGYTPQEEDKAQSGWERAVRMARGQLRGCPKSPSSIHCLCSSSWAELCWRLMCLALHCPVHHVAMEGRAKPCVAEREKVSGSAREEMNSGLKDDSGRSLFLRGKEL